MAIGHAMGIAEASELSAQWVIAAPILIALFNMGGSLLGGLLSDRLPTKWLMGALPLLSGSALIAMAELPNGVPLLTGFALLGFSYGATIAAYPAIISNHFGAQAGVAIYGRVFTAWGLAGLLAPWFAGVIYDTNNDYRLALWVAAGISVVSLYTALRHPLKVDQSVKAV